MKQTGFGVAGASGLVASVSEECGKPSRRRERSELDLYPFSCGGSIFPRRMPTMVGRSSTSA